MAEDNWRDHQRDSDTQYIGTSALQSRGKAGSWRRQPRILMTLAGVVSAIAVAVVGSAPALASAPAFSQVSGSPFSAGAGSYSVAFGPSGNLLAVANSRLSHF